MKLKIMMIALLAGIPHFAYGIGLMEAGKLACISYFCGPRCQQDNVLYGNAERKCSEGNIDMTIECPTAGKLTLKSNLNSLRNLSGSDDVDNPVECSFQSVGKRGELYFCDSYHGSPYAFIETMVDLRKVKPGAFEMTIMARNYEEDEDLGESLSIKGFHHCSVSLDIH